MVGKVVVFEGYSGSMELVGFVVFGFLVVFGLFFCGIVVSGCCFIVVVRCCCWWYLGVVIVLVWDLFGVVLV